MNQSAELDALRAEMRARRAGPAPAPRDELMTPQMAALLGCDTPDGNLRYQRISAWRDAGYTGPLDSRGEIADPDDPANADALAIHAYLRTQREA